MYAAPPPNQHYYRSVHGRWSSPLDFAITNRPAFWSIAMGWLDRARLLSMTFLPKLLGPLRLDTSVDFLTGGTEGIVVHTTRVSKFGMTFLSSVETIKLDPDGRRFAMSGELRLFPTLWRSRGFAEGGGEVNETGTEANYRFAWFGTEMVQRGVVSVDANTVTLTQETPFSRGEQVLLRMHKP